MKASTRKALPKSDFGLPAQKKYPMPDRSHAANAKARATQQVKAGNLTPGQKAQVDAKANKVLKGASFANGGQVGTGKMPAIGVVVTPARKGGGMGGKGC